MTQFIKCFSIVLLGLSLAVMGCAETEDYDDADDGNTSMENTEGTMQDGDSMNERNGEMNNYSMAIATINPTQGNNASGMVSFSKGTNGVDVSANLSNLPEGDHGFHVHLYGDCSTSDGTSAGTHYNFEGSSTNPPADIDRITGNLGNLMAGSNGSATADTTISNTSIKDIMGRSVIVHANANDPNQPPIGAAGARLGCGVIGHANPESMIMDDNNM